jgi:release factor glutamine methyltransferase
MNTLGQLFQKSCAYLESKGIKEAKREAELLFMQTLKLDRLSLYLSFDKPLCEDEVICLRDRLQKRSIGIPNAYINGKVEFLGCELTVSPDVLIPRPETELLAEKVIASIQDMPNQNISIWDVCTGSGALAIAIKKHVPLATVYASDISEQALAIAISNAESNNCSITFFKGDLFEPFKKELYLQKANVIVSNPPYIALSESIDREVADFEPKIALYGGSDGLDFYRRIATEAPNLLESNGKLWLELGYTQSEAVKEIFTQSSPTNSSSTWGSIQILKDYSGWSRYFYLESGAQTVYD